MKLLDPVFTPSLTTASDAARLDTFDGKRICLLHNGKTNAAELLSEVEIELRNRYAISSVVTGRYPGSRLMDCEQVQALGGCDLVTLAVGD
jgi:hypothetical protein